MRTIFSCKGSTAAEFRQNYGEIVRREFYDGDLDVDDADNIDVIFQKALDHPITLMRISSSTGISYRRSISHIRQNKIGVRVIWFVRHGSLKLVRSNQTCLAKAGECAILDSNSPFHARAMVGENHLFENKRLAIAKVVEDVPQEICQACTKRIFLECSKDL